MAEILKFPKDKAQYINLLKELKNNEDYYSIIKLSDRLWENFELLKDTDVFDYLSMAYFELGNYHEVVRIYHSLFNKNKESFTILYYTLASLIANQDVYQGMHIIKTSNVLKEPTLEVFISREGANYNNLSNLDADAFGDVVLVLLLVNFFEAIARESLSQGISRDYLLFRFYDMINIILEIGFEDRIINDLNELSQKIFIIN